MDHIRSNPKSGLKEVLIFPLWVYIRNLVFSVVFHIDITPSKSFFYPKIEKVANIHKLDQLVSPPSQSYFSCICFISLFYYIKLYFIRFNHMLSAWQVGLLWLKSTSFAPSGYTALLCSCVIDTIDDRFIILLDIEINFLLLVCVGGWVGGGVIE